MNTTYLFLYGTLRDAGLRRIVAGCEVAAQDAWLSGHQPRQVEGHSFPVLVPAETDDGAQGVIVKADETAFKRLCYYESGFKLGDVAVETPSDQIQAQAFFSDTPTWEIGGIWQFEDWQSSPQRAMALEVAEEYMRLFPHQSTEQADRYRGQIEMRASTRIRAAANPSPNPLSPSMEGRQTNVKDTRQPYSAFFAIREDDLSFPRFDGTESPTVTRACFIGGDAVTILPWDPRTDEVLLVRQWRHGPFCRGDENPWTLEPVAGRIDPGEAPKSTAIRELAEETGLSEIGPLHEVAHYYPSPGAYSEFLYNYVAEADLSHMNLRVAGIEGEAEDIMSHVLPLDTALNYITTGAVNTGPLVVSLQWLALNCSRLKSG